MSARSPIARPPASLPVPWITPTTPVPAIPACTSSQPNARSRSCTTALVRVSCSASSGWACRSWRQAVMSAWNSAMRLWTGMAASLLDMHR